MTYISADLRRLVAGRARFCCEYCLLHERDTMFGCHIDHVISEKHGGPTDESNLAYACASCNRAKGSDVGSLIVLPTGTVFCRFFNPRTDLWDSHFPLSSADGITTLSATDIGTVTVRILGFNVTERLLERESVFAAGGYPPQ